MKSLCASSVTFGEASFASLGPVELRAETDISPGFVGDVEAVITRTKTKLTPDLFEGTAVRFVGTCTAGTDHADIPGLQKLGIHFASAPGCNANAVSEYVIAALLEADENHGFTLKGSTIGIVGHGQVGTRVEKKAAALGMKVLRHDPPKEESGSAEAFVDLDTLLTQSDVVTLHVPLVEEGPHPTRNLVCAEGIRKMKPGAILINACRGEALDAEAAVRARQEGNLSWLVMDVWDPEPNLPQEILAGVDLGSAHIAGHSVEGKVNGTRQIREALVAYFQLDTPAWDPTPLLPPPEHSCVELPEWHSFQARLRSAVRACYDIRFDDQLLREKGGKSPGEHFTFLRRNYRDRREFSATEVVGCTASEIGIYHRLGFQVKA
jgi:erythronate-4-phosphate dehydrogenase